jgi:hypothetical protein
MENYVLPKDALAKARVESVLTDLQLAPSKFHLGEMLGMRSQPKYLKRANTQLKRYLQFPVVFVDPDSGKFTSKMEPYSGDAWEQEAINLILDLLAKGEVWRLKRCHCCRNWFYAIREDQRFCKTACRQKEHSQSPEFKARRAKYMRDEYRPGERNRDLQSRKLSKSKQQ